jgi:hypothetical protein
MDKKEVKKVAKKMAKRHAAKVESKRNQGQSVPHGPALAQSSYLRTILDAVNNPGVKIPDDVTTPSYTFQTLTKFIISSTTGAGGNTGAGFYRTLGNTRTVASTGYATLAPGATPAVYGATGVTSPWAAQLATQTQSTRLVSAKATMTYLGTPLSASGRFLLAFLPPGRNNSYQSAAGAFLSAGLVTLVALPNLADVPAAKAYAEARYVPLDPVSRSYEVSDSLAIGTLRSDPAYTLLATYGAFLGIIDGCAAGVDIEVNIWENYEAIPQSSLVNLVQPTPSLSDPIEMAVVSNVVSSAPSIPILQSSKQSLGVAQAAPIGTDTTSAEPVKSGHKITKSDDVPFMDKMFGWAGKGIDLAIKAAPVVAGIAALL